MESNLFFLEFSKLFPELNLALGTGMMIFARFIGLIQYAPPFNRSELPTMAKISFTLIMTIVFTIMMKPGPAPSGTSILLCLILNFTFGFLIGYIVNCIIAAVSAAGDIINSQMGVSSATVLDPTSGSQASLLGNFFTVVAIIIFIKIGGMYWVIDAFIRSFSIFPVYATKIPLEQIITLDYLSKVTFNIFITGMQIAAPILLATLGQDIILGTISKTAPQVNVFQMSFLAKPVMGATILTWVLPMLINVITDYLNSYAGFF